MATWRDTERAEIQMKQNIAKKIEKVQQKMYTKRKKAISTAFAQTRQLNKLILK